MSLRDFATQPLHFQVPNTRKASSSLKVFYEHWVYKKQSISFPLFYRKMTGRFLFPLPSSGKMHTFFFATICTQAGSGVWIYSAFCIERGYKEATWRGYKESDFSRHPWKIFPTFCSALLLCQVLMLSHRKILLKVNYFWQPMLLFW